MMEQRSLFNFVIRCIILIIFWVVAHLPTSWDVRVDAPAIVGAITVLGEDGVSRVSAEDWQQTPSAFAPSVPPQETPPSAEGPVHGDLPSSKEQLTDRQSIFDQFSELRAHMARFLVPRPKKSTGAAQTNS